MTAEAELLLTANASILGQRNKTQNFTFSNEDLLTFFFLETNGTTDTHLEMYKLISYLS